MTVLQEIVDWSRDRPLWQRDALRRLTLRGELTEDDILTLSTICKSAHGLAEQQESLPLTKDDVPSEATGAAVSLA